MALTISDQQWSDINTNLGQAIAWLDQLKAYANGLDQGELVDLSDVKLQVINFCNQIESTYHTVRKLTEGE